MLKKQFFGLAASIMFFACQEEQVIEVQPQDETVSEAISINNLSLLNQKMIISKYLKMNLIWKTKP